MQPKHSLKENKNTIKKENAKNGKTQKNSGKQKRKNEN